MNDSHSVVSPFQHIGKSFSLKPSPYRETPMRARYGLTALTAVTLITLSPVAIAWEVSCSVDDFTDKRTCRMSNYTHTPDRAELTFMLVRGDEGSPPDTLLGVHDWRSRLDDTFLLRIDDLPHRDLEKDAFHIHSRTTVSAVVTSSYAEDLAREIMEGETINVRVRERFGATKTLTFDTDGFEAAWQRLKEESE